MLSESVLSCFAISDSKRLCISAFQYVRFFVDVGSVFDLKLLCCPRLVAPTLVTLPSMSLIPFAPFASWQAWQAGRRAKGV